MKKEDIYQAKQVWLERVMASKLTPAQKVFAFSIYKRAYGLKVTSFPGPKDIVEDTNLTPGKFSEHRKALFACGALSGVKARHESGTQDNYTYTLELGWDGTVPPTDTAVTPVDTTVTPEGETHYPRGGSNTTINTSSKTTSKTTKNKATAVADAPALRMELKEEEIRDMEIIEKTREQMFKEGSLPTFSNLVGVTASYSLPNKKAGTSTEERSVALVREKVAELAAKKDKARAHLENQILKDGLNAAQADQARAWFDDAQWRAGQDPVQRASWAVHHASDIGESA